MAAGGKLHVVFTMREQPVQCFASGRRRHTVCSVAHARKGHLVACQCGRQGVETRFQQR